MQNPSLMRAYTTFEASDAMKHKEENGVKICFEYSAGAPTSVIVCWAVSYNGIWYMDGYDYPNDTLDRPLQMNEEIWNRLMELLS